MKLQLKGKRNYITGADIINFYKSKFLKKTKIVFNFYKLTSKFLKFKKVISFKEKKYNSKKLVCTITIGSSEKYIILEKNQKIKKRVLFNEKKFFEDSFIKKNSIITNYKKLNFFDNIVALNKTLLNNLIGKYKWIFCKLEILQIKNLIYKKIKIIFIDKSGNFYVSKIMIDGKKIGKIYFYKK